MLPLKVKDIVYDLSLNPVVLLVDEKEEQVLPIWIGPLEAQVIALFLSKVEVTRPLTHDIICSICQRFEAGVDKIVISDMREGTYYAELYLKKDEHEQIIIDLRPSDAIALALRSTSPIYLGDRVYDQLLPIEELSDEQQKELKKILDSTDTNSGKNHLH
ncbi:MAG TPA: bifunctional nuclease family protein [Clostridia bacterium]|nr:bifunctional nuclease family protein [Clostridia bacterium]